VNVPNSLEIQVGQLLQEQTRDLTNKSTAMPLRSAADGDEVRWLATELRGALGGPAVERPEADDPTE